MIEHNTEYFDKILLFKPQGDMTYIRKLSMSYGYYTALAVVNKQNLVTHVGANNHFQILPFNKLSHKYKNLLGSEKCKHLQDDDIMSIYRIREPLELCKPYRLLKPCLNMRFTLDEETFYLKKLILSTLSEKHNVSVYDAEKLSEYTRLYEKHMPLDFNNLLQNFDEEYNTEHTIPMYNNSNAIGQTRLI